MLDENSSKLKAERLKAKGRRLGSLDAGSRIRIKERTIEAREAYFGVFQWSE